MLAFCWCVSPRPCTSQCRRRRQLAKFDFVVCALASQHGRGCRGALRRVRLCDLGPFDLSTVSACGLRQMLCGNAGAGTSARSGVMVVACQCLAIETINTLGWTVAATCLLSDANDSIDRPSVCAGPAWFYLHGCCGRFHGNIAL